MSKRMSYRDRLIASSPVWSEILQRTTPFVQNKLITGGAAGQLAVSGIKKGDEIVSVINLTTPADMTDEFKANDIASGEDKGMNATDGYIDNTGGTATTAENLLVSYLSWVDVTA
jgi:hypothetical protein